MLYKLIISDLEFHEDFSIGIFHSRYEAEKIANFYFANVKGFRDFPCTAKISVIHIAGLFIDTISEVFIVLGWNTDKNINEVDIIESPCFVSRSQALLVLEQMKQQHERSCWTVQCWKVGQAEWAEGFERS